MDIQELVNIIRLLVPLFFLICVYLIYKILFKKDIQTIKRNEHFTYWFFYLKSVILILVLVTFLYLLRYFSGSLEIQDSLLRDIIASYTMILALFGVVAVLIKVFGFDKIENMSPQGIKDWLKLLIMVLMGIFIVSFLIIELKKSLSILVVFIVSLLLG